MSAYTVLCCVQVINTDSIDSDVIPAHRPISVAARRDVINGHLPLSWQRSLDVSGGCKEDTERVDVRAAVESRRPASATEVRVKVEETDGDHVGWFMI